MVDLPIDGQPRKALLSAQRNGYVYVLDRTTGQVLSATPFIRITSSKGVDLEDRPLDHERGEDSRRSGKVIRDIAPASPGAKDWQPCAWSPRTRLLYIPHQNLAMDYEGTEASYIEGTPYLGANVKMYANGRREARRVLRLGPGREEESVGDQGGVSGLERGVGHRRRRRVLRDDGRFVQSGERKDGRSCCGSSRPAPGSSGSRPPIRDPTANNTSRSFPASAAGPARSSRVISTRAIRPAALGFANAMKDLPEHTTKGGTLYVFSLP